ncbi:cytochrome ubiquinol oxidase subunit I [Gorillibacterium timonense]|uniref:cytochrome ubiquinol oxidase subunit I n=1 Tax=Gorillibacterium timonense TaxID=1689269 RepID=UPI00071D3E5E|nr:cytochrome ubiquinol oxidase subunit I [Gorillibacterium timonense]
MDSVTLSRALFGTSMAFHIIFATLGVGLPLMILLAELMFQKTKDADYELMARRWTKAFGILLGVGIPSGTIVGVLISLLFPGFMQIVGQVIALPFQIEIWAFFLEALFMTIYVYAAARLSPALRITSLALVAFGALMSAVLITDAQAWMNTPTGFRMVNGQVTDVDPWAAFFNPAFPFSASHVGISAFLTGSFAAVSAGAWMLLKPNRTERERAYHGKGLRLALTVGGVFAILTAVNGHAVAQALARHNPEKLAAAEALFETRTHAPLSLLGIADPDTRTLKYAIEIPGGLSFLATNRFDGVVKGLDQVPREDWPPLYTHTLFNGMVGIGFFLILVPLAVWAFRRFRRKELPRWLLYVCAVSGPLAMLGTEFGWIFSCSGRQPWTIYHIQRTTEAATKTGNIGTLFLLFAGLYLFLFVATGFVMYFYFRTHPVAREWNSAPETGVQS